MKKLSKPAVLLGATALAGLAFAGSTAIHAATTSTSGDPVSGLVQAIATKFNLQTADVQAVFDEQHAAMETQRAADEKSRLDQAVKDGKLTQAQEDLIIAKQAEEKTFMESLKDKSEADRRAALESHRTELEKWITANNIPKEYMRFGFMVRGHRGMGGPGGPGSGPEFHMQMETGTATSAN